jgi:hypothetical protein
VKIEIVGAHFLANALRRIRPKLEKQLARELTTMAKKVVTAPKPSGRPLSKKEVRQQLRAKKKEAKRVARFDKKIDRLLKKINALSAKKTKLEKKRDLGGGGGKTK